MGVNYGQFRNRSESLRDLREVVAASIGTTKYTYERFSIVEEVARITNANLDIVQRRYNERFNFPTS